MFKTMEGMEVPGKETYGKTKKRRIRTVYSRHGILKTRYNHLTDNSLQIMANPESCGSDLYSHFINCLYAKRGHKSGS